MFLSPQDFKLVTGKINTDVLNAINATLLKYNITTPLRIRHFLAQLLHESNNLTAVRENLNYSASALQSTFKKYFPTEALANQYARKPEAIGNKVYANRMGNGSEASGEGFRYRGRGYIQLTGKDSYKALSGVFGVDLVAKPELLETPLYAALSAGWYWDSRNLNKHADADDILTITKKINGGTNGYADRVANYNKLKNIIK